MRSSSGDFRKPEVLCRLQSQPAIHDRLPVWELLLSGRDREALAASCAATIQHVATTFGLHAGPKSVGSFTTLIVWLECTLHDNCLRLRRAQIDIRCGAPRQAETQNMVNPEPDRSNPANLPMLHPRGRSVHQIDQNIGPKLAEFESWATPETANSTSAKNRPSGVKSDHSLVKSVRFCPC